MSQPTDGPVDDYLARVTKLIAMPMQNSQSAEADTLSALLARHEPDAAADKSNPKDIAGMRKAPLRFVPPALLLFVSKVMELGAKKYGAQNWRAQPIRFSIYIEAAQRHLLALQDGQDIDPESGQPHAAHVAACMGIVLDAKELGTLIDDRPTAGPAADLIERFTVRS